MIKKEAYNISCLLLLISFLTLQTGCGYFLPPHANSFYTKDETVTVKMLTCDELKDYKEDWRVYFGSYCDEPKAFAFAPAIALAAGIVVPIVVDYAKTKLKEESENYVQQFGTTYFGTSWENKDKKKYYGFEIVRNAKRYNDTGEKEEVFKIVYGFLKDDKDIFWAAPLYFKTNKTKAKVSSWGSSHKINTKVEIALDAVWIDGQKKYHKENIAKFDPLIIKDYEIDSPKVLRSSFKGENPDKYGRLEGGLNSFPISEKFWLTVLVTETDTAKTKKYITDLSDILEKNKDKIIDFIKSQTN